MFTATEDLLRAATLDDLRVEDIAAAAGVSRRTFYSYFPSKESVAIGLVARFMAETTQLLDLDPIPGESGRDLLRRVVRRNIELWLAHSDVLRMMNESWHRVAEIREMWAGAINRFTDLLAAEIDRQRAQGEAPPGVNSAQLASLLMWGTGHCLYVAGIGVDERLAGQRDIEDGLVAMWMGTIYSGDPEDDPPARA